MLSKVITEKLIKLNVEVNNWEEALRISASPLLLEKKITQEYVEKIIENYNEIGPYFVITKHTALPHARSENGAKELAIGITTLKDSVVSGSEANDPIKYLFCLSAPDNNSHLSALASLVELFSDEEFFKVLDGATKPKEVLDYIKNKEHKKD